MTNVMSTRCGGSRDIDFPSFRERTRERVLREIRSFRMSLAAACSTCMHIYVRIYELIKRSRNVICIIVRK